MSNDPKLHVISENDIPEPERTNVFQFNPDSLDELRRRKLIRETEETIELEGIAMGETLVGELNDTERALYIEIASLHAGLNDLHRELVAKTLDIYATSVRETNTPLQAHEKFMKDHHKVFPSADDAEEYFAMQTKYEYLRAYYNFCIRERFGHGWTYGVRRGWQVVRTERKYELPK